MIDDRSIINSRHGSEFLVDIPLLAANEWHDIGEVTYPNRTSLFHYRTHTYLS